MIFFFDLDETLRQTKSGKTFINEPTDQQPIPGAEKAVKYYSDRGYICIGITNQGGVVAGYKSLESAIEEQQITLEIFPNLSKILFCPDDGETCIQVFRNKTSLEFSKIGNSFRKPGYGMIEIAIQEFRDLELEKCWMAGDRPEDFECAKSAGINFIWANIMLDKFVPGIHEKTIANIDKEILLKFLAI